MQKTCKDKRLVMAWHIWSINPSRYKRILKFIESLDVVEEVVIPLVDKDIIDLRSGLVRTKTLPIYKDYIFLKYSDPTIFKKLSASSLFYKYIGECDDEEIKAVTVYDDLRNLVGTKVKILKTPFENKVGTVLQADENHVYVLISVDGGVGEVVCNKSEIAVVETL